MKLFTRQAIYQSEFSDFLENVKCKYTKLYFHKLQLFLKYYKIITKLKHSLICGLLVKY